ncbi:acyl-homoserine-lactone synthase [Vibrio chagasii]|nr:acyl-homoserine-lactone synthase [Vibrio chagasii]
MDYRDLVQRYPKYFSSDMVLLERAASQFYMSWLDFWYQM